MNPYFVYYLSFFIGVIIYIKINNHYMSVGKITRRVVYIKRAFILSLYIIGAVGINLAREMKGESFFRWFIFISSVIILFTNIYLITKLESLRS